MSSGGLPERRPDQRLISTTRAGSGPAPQNTVFIGRLVVVFGTGAGTGLFVYSGSPGPGNPPILAITTASRDPYGNAVTASAITDSGMPLLIYSGTPAAGNLIASIAPASGTDGFGNPYLAGITTYSPGDATFAVQMTANQINYYSFIGGMFTPVIFQSEAGINPAIASQPYRIGNLTDLFSQLSLFSSQVLVSATSIALETAALLEVQGVIAASSIEAIVAGAAETWHSITTGFPAGWSGSVNYRQLAEQSLVMVDWALQASIGTVITVGETIATLPAGYFFATDNKFLPGNGTGGGAADVWAPAQINTAGAFKFSGAAITPAGSAFFWYGQGVFTTAV